MRKKLQSYIKILLFLLFVTISQLSYAQKSETKAIDGVLDLTNIDFDNSKVISIVGDWKFYYNELLTPTNIRNKTNLHPPLLVYTPGVWNNNSEMEAHAFGTYHLIIKVKYNDLLSINFQGVSSAYKLWIDNKLVGEVGEVGKSKNEYVPKYQPKVYPIILDSTKSKDEIQTIEIVMQVANFYHVNSGIWEIVEIGSFDETNRHTSKKNFLIVFIAGILMIMSIYHFGIFALHTERKSTLFFGFVTFIMAIRALTTDNRLLLDLFPDINFFIFIKIEYLSAYTNIAFIGLFFYFMFKKDVNKLLIRILTIIIGIFALIIIFTPVNFFTSLRDVYNIGVLFTGLYITFFALIKAMINKREGSTIAFIGMLILFSTGIIDIITTLAILPIPYLSPYGLVIYTFSQAYNISILFSKSFNKNKKLSAKLDEQNHNLEQIVKQRAEEILSQKKELEIQNKTLEKSQLQLEQNIQELKISEEEQQQNYEELVLLNEIISVKEKRLAYVLENQGEGFATINLEGDILFTNPAAEGIFEVERGDLEGFNIISFIGEEQYLFLKNKLQKTEKGERNIFEIGITTAKNNKKILEVNLTPDFNNNKEKIGQIGVFRDITKRKEIERELKRYFIVIEQSPVAILIANSEGDIEYINPKFTEVTGYEPTEIIGKNPEILNSGQTPKSTIKDLWDTILQGKVWSGEFINKRKDNSIFIEKATISPVISSEGEIKSYIALKEDITELRKAEQIIKEHTEQQQILINNLPANIYFKDIDLNYILVNDSFAELLGIGANEIVGKNDRELSPKDIAELYEGIDKKLIETQKPIFNYEEKHQDLDGNNYWASTSKVPYFNEQGKIKGIIGIVQDITERKNLEEEREELFRTTQAQKETIEISHKKIQSSINYASSIQNALLPSDEYLKELLKEYFIFFKPKEIVSGDFYYATKIYNTSIFCVADCTGHGVPGAFMTVLSISQLNNIIRKDKYLQPSEILEQLRSRIKEVFSQFGSENANGLDIALCALNTDTNEIQYAGAYNPLYIIRDEELIIHKANKNPIGFYPKERPFTNKTIQLYKNDIIYIFSDGFKDQYGEKIKRKYASVNFKKLLIKIHKEGLEKQKNLISTELSQWQGNLNQLDDIAIMGIKIN